MGLNITRSAVERVAVKSAASVVHSKVMTAVAQSIARGRLTTRWRALQPQVRAPVKLTPDPVGGVRGDQHRRIRARLRVGGEGPIAEELDAK